jgi:uncharacterized membrane-anchored protein
MSGMTAGEVTTVIKNVVETLAVLVALVKQLLAQPPQARRRRRHRRR